jgi:hypothetical protein
LLLELAFQSLDDGRELTLTTLFDFLSKFLVDSTPLLQIALLVLLPALGFQVEARLAEGGVCFAFHTLAPLRLARAQHALLFRRHLHPALRI